MNTLAFTLGEYRSPLTLKISTYPNGCLLYPSNFKREDKEYVKREYEIATELGKLMRAIDPVSYTHLYGISTAIQCPAGLVLWE